MLLWQFDGLLIFPWTFQFKFRAGDGTDTRNRFTSVPGVRPASTCSGGLSGGVLGGEAHLAATVTLGPAVWSALAPRAPGSSSDK